MNVAVITSSLWIRYTTFHSFANLKVNDTMTTVLTLNLVSAQDLRYKLCAAERSQKKGNFSGVVLKMLDLRLFTKHKIPAVDFVNFDTSIYLVFHF